MHLSDSFELKSRYLPELTSVIRQLLTKSRDIIITKRRMGDSHVQQRLKGQSITSSIFIKLHKDKPN